MKYQDKIRIFSQKQENQDIFKISGKNQESSVAAKPALCVVKALFKKHIC
jgi:hypothetical protein